MGLFEKRRARNFFSFLQSYKEQDPSTHQGILHLYRIFCALLTLRYVRNQPEPRLHEVRL